MAQDGEVSVRIKVTAEDGGVARAESGLKRVGAAAKKAAEASKGGLAGVRASVGKVSGAFGALRAVLSGVGAVAFAETVAAGLGKIRESFGRSRKEAEAYAAAQERAARAEDVERLAKAYEALEESIAGAAAARAHGNEVADIELRNARALEDAMDELAEQRELAAVDPDGAAAEEERAEIRARHAMRRADAAGRRGMDDAARESRRLREGAAAGRRDADAVEASTAEDDRLIADARARARAADAASVGRNGEDVGGFWSAFGHNARNIVRLDWGRVGEARTEAGDAERARAAEEAERAKAEAKALEGRRAAKLERARRLREDAARAEEKADALDGAERALEARADAARLRDAQALGDAERAADRRRGEAAAADAKVGDAKRARELLAGQRADIQARIAAERERKDAANLSVYMAQGDYDAARLGGSRRAQQSALGSLQAAQGAAQDVNHAADRAIAALTETLRSVENRLKAAQSFLESQSKQQRNAWAEAPAGS